MDNDFRMAGQIVQQFDVTSSGRRDAQNQTFSTSRKAYQECIGKLNSLQQPLRHLEKIPITADGAIRCQKSMVQYLKRCGIGMEEINRVPVIHVAGTKGKGSVCAFSESILRKCGLKTGLFTSPHLIEVRERFRINGKPIGYDKFVSYFSEVFSRLEESKEDFGGGMPVYKEIICVLGFYIFVKEKVDVAVIEVGLGGEYDVTNFIREPIVCGITSLGMDHVELLGNTITEIAWHKSGILKPGKPAFTVPQPPKAMAIIMDRAKEIGTTVQCVAAFENFDFWKHPVKLGIHGKHQRANAALAVQLCRKFVEITKNTRDVFKVSSTEKHPTSKDEPTAYLSNRSDIIMKTSEPFVLPNEFLLGLKDCYWPGRSQTVMRDRVTYYLDGAHTENSIKHCVEWFLEASSQEDASTHHSTVKMLVFNLKPEKYKPSLIRPLLNCRFAGAAFCPSYINDGENSADQTFVATKREEDFLNSQNIKRKFEDLETSLRIQFVKEGNTEKSQSSGETEQQILDQENSIESVTELRKAPKCVALPSIEAALRWASAGKDSLLGAVTVQDPPLPVECLEADRMQILITGSLYLIGGTLKLLDPSLALQ